MTYRTDRRTLLSLATAFAVSSCANASGTRSPFWTTLINFRRPANGPIDRKKVDKIPYATMLAWFDGSAKALLVLAEYATSDRLIWASAQQQSVTTWGPFVTRLLGLEVSLQDTMLASGWSRDLRQMTGHATYLRTFDFRASGSHHQVSARSSFRAVGLEDIAILGSRRNLLKIDETIVYDGPNRRGNEYWVDSATGACVKSRQIVVPTMPHFNIEIVHAPKGQQT